MSTAPLGSRSALDVRCPGPGPSRDRDTRAAAGRASQRMPSGSRDANCERAWPCRGPARPAAHPGPLAMKTATADAASSTRTPSRLSALPMSRSAGLALDGPPATLDDTLTERRRGRRLAGGLASPRRPRLPLCCALSELRAGSLRPVVASTQKPPRRQSEPTSRAQPPRRGPRAALAPPHHAEAAPDPSRHAYQFSARPRRRPGRRRAARFVLATRIAPYSRCARCNGRVVPAPKGEVVARIPPRTAAWLEGYYLCEACGQLYWEGTHVERLRVRIADIATRAADVVS